MEMIADEDIDRGKDITPAVLPLAFALSDSFLSSHCSSCFRSLNPSSHSLPNNPTHTSIPQPSHLSCHAHCNSSVRYCSHQCFSADSHLHVYSGECRLLACQSESPTSQHGDSADIRVALRLIVYFGDSAHSTAGRIGGLMTNRRKLEEDPEISETILDGARMMSLARRGSSSGEERVDCSVEEDVLCVVLTNGVEVQVSEGRAVGTAVYGPCFSWFNHSCVPNACYRFSLAGRGELNSGGTDFLVSASSTEAMLKTWIVDESKLIQDCRRNGPRVTVRSITPIKKGEEVCIAYMDLLQPKVVRRSELWLKYRFDCCCTRCSASPPTYVDLILEGNATSHIDYSCKYEGCEELDDCLYQVLEDISSGNPKACYKRLEIILAEGFKVKYLHHGETLQPKFKLHPLHHLSLSSYITLSSAYQICANSLLSPDSGADNQLDALRLRRAAAACSLLLAGATHHFLSSEASLIASSAHFWKNAGETLLALISSPSWSTLAKQSSKSDFSTIPRWINDECLLLRELESYLACSQSQMDSESLGEFHKICQGFFYRARGMLSKLWPFLVDDLDYLEDIEDPVDFRWLGLTSLHPLDEAQMVVRGEKASCVFTQIDEVGEKSLLELAVHCLLFGGYLSGICYGEYGFLSLSIRSLIQEQRDTLLGKSSVCSGSVALVENLMPCDLRTGS